MSDAGGRRIKRALFLDVQTIRFADEELVDRWGKIHLLKDYLKQKREEIEKANKERGTDLKRVFPMGSEVRAEIIEADGGKLKLSIVGAQRSEERADMNAWKAEQAKKVQSSGGFNSLADKLKGLKLG